MKIVNIVALALVISIVWFIVRDSKTPIISKQVTTTPIPSPTPFIFSEKKLWSLVNEWRISQNLSSYTEDQRLCNLTEIRLKETSSDNSHNGFWKHINDFPHNGLAENLTSDYIFEESSLGGWLNSPPHRKTLEDNYKYSCLKCLGDRCVQLFANF